MLTITFSATNLCADCCWCSDRSCHSSLQHHSHREVQETVSSHPTWQFWDSGGVDVDVILALWAVNGLSIVCWVVILLDGRLAYSFEIVAHGTTLYSAPWPRVLVLILVKGWSLDYVLFGEDLANKLVKSLLANQLSRLWPWCIIVTCLQCRSLGHLLEKHFHS